jgi:cell wall-associated NlpC family hydrolase
MTRFFSILGVGVLVLVYSLTSSGQEGGHPVDRIIDRAHQLLGKSYRLGGQSVDSGFDCSGLMVYLFKSEAGIHLPRTAASMHKGKGKVVDRAQLKRGDAVFFKHNKRQPISHVGIYIGNNRFIHAPRKGKVIRIDSLSNNYWDKRYVSSKRLHNLPVVSTKRQL